MYAPLLEDPHFPLVAWAMVLAYYDLRLRRLPNGLTLGAAVLGMAYLLICGRSLLGASPSSAWAAGIGAVVVLLPFCRLEWLGAGDVKLMSAIGFLCGLDVLMAAFVFSSLLSFPAALWQCMRRCRNGEVLSPRARRLPQGVFLGAGLLLALFGGVPA